jgi:hypothetical protein
MARAIGDCHTGVGFDDRRCKPTSSRTYDVRVEGTEIQVDVGSIKAAHSPA